MSVDHVEVVVEEPSMEEALRLLLPKMLVNTSFEVYTHQCNNEMLIRLPERLRGYKTWIPENWRILVIVDRDDDDCTKLKMQLEQMSKDAGLATRSQAGGSSFTVVNRLAIEELEAWYFGDWDAVRAAYPRVPETIPTKSKYRNPDGIAGGTWEAFEKVLQTAGYFEGGLRKIEAARAIAPHMVPTRNRSRSFQALYAAVAGMCSLG
jgi:Domain of unknown function (DUF4276)